MNNTQVKTFLACLSQIDDTNFIALRSLTHSHSHQDNEANGDIHDHLRHDEEEDEDSSNKDILIAKATAMTVLFCASTICGSIPFLLNRYFKWTERQDNARSAVIVQCLLYFGGGVLLATTFLHLLPEVQEVVENMEKCDIIPTLQFRLAELLMCVGFFFMYLVEETIHAFINHHRKRLDREGSSAAAAFERGQSVRNSFLVRGKNNKSSSAQEELSEKESSEKLEKVISEAIIPIGTNEQGSAVQKAVAHPECVQNGRDLNDNHAHAHVHGHSHLPLNEADGLLTSSIRGLFIVLALSLHELFEGMAIGLETASAASVWFMFGAVSAHKLVLAFCVGVELIVARTRMPLAITYVITFAIVSPIGIGIGILLSSGSGGSSAAPSIPAAVLQGLACGTLLYVVFFEILSKDHSGLRTYVALVVGFAAMFALQQIGTGGHHGHSHGGCGHSHTEDDHDHDDHESGHLHHEKKLDLAEQIRILRNASERIGEGIQH